jgi:predicted DNA-binding protein
MTIRKNFNFNEEIARHLEEKAKREAKTQTQYLEELIEKDIREEKRAKRLEALERLAGSLSGKIGDIDIKEARGAYLAEKYGY